MGWDRSLVVRLLCHILSARQTLSINHGRSAAENLPEREMQSPELVCAASPSVAFGVTCSIAPRERASLFDSVVSVGELRHGQVLPGCGDAKRELRFTAFPLLANLPSPKAAGDRPSWSSGAAGGPEPATGANFRGAGLGARCECASPTFRGWRRFLSLHTSPYMHRLHQPALFQPHK